MKDSTNPAMERSVCCADGLAKQDFEDQINAIRHALLIGLESFGEVERITWHFDSRQAAGDDVSAELRPMHPTGTAETVGIFAGALRLLDTLGAECADPQSINAYELNVTIKAIRRAMHIGLYSFGEVERISDYCEAMRRRGESFNAHMEPVHPTGASDTVSMFADALRLLDAFEPELTSE